MEKKTESPIDVFLKLTIDKESRQVKRKASCAEFLYEWLEVLEMCGFDGEFLEKILKQQQMTVGNALTSKEPLAAERMVQEVKKAARDSIQRFKECQKIMLEHPVLVEINYDKDSRVMFRFKLADEHEVIDEITITNAMFLNLVGQLHLDPKRMNSCPKCGNLFYQHQRTSQKYCSRACSDMGRSGKKMLTAKE